VTEELFNLAGKLSVTLCVLLTHIKLGTSFS
jgi:hypothetical protein